MRIVKWSFVVLVSVLLCSCVSLPYGSSVKTDVFESSLSVLEEANSSLRRSVLDNGMVCLVKEDHAAPVVSVQIWVGTGSVNEEEFLGAGISHAIEHMIFKGTEKRAPNQISLEIKDAGGRINAYTSFDRTVFYTDLPSSGWRVGLDVLSDAVMHGSFPAEEWEKERTVIMREMAMGKDDPARVISKLLWRTAYRVHPYRMPVIGYKDIFKKITRDDLLKFARRNYVADNMFVVIVGDIDAQEVEDAIGETFKDFDRKVVAPEVLPQEQGQISDRFARETGVYNVSRLEWSYHSVSMDHPDAPALDVLAAIAGQGRSSRLNRKIKEELKLVYSIDAWSYTPKEPGIFGISASFDPSKEDAVISAVQEEIDFLSSNLVSQKEIDKVRRMVLSSELAGLQTMEGKAKSYASGEFYAGDPRFSETYLKQIEEVTPAKLRDVARKYLPHGKRTLVVLSPSEVEVKKKNDIADKKKIKIKKVMLSSGMPLIVREDNRLPFVNFCAVFKGGLLAEKESNNGITKLMSDLLVRGTKTRKNEGIVNTVESLGGRISGISGYNSFGLQATCLSGDKEEFMQIFSDCLLNPVFPQEELDKRKEIQAAAIDQQYESPFFLAREGLREALFPGHPYRMSTLGTKKSLQAINRSEIDEYFKVNAVSGNMVLAIFGNITTEEAKKLAERYLAAMPKGSAPDRKNKKPKVALPVRRQKEMQKEQAILLIGFPGIDVKDPRNEAMALLKDSMSGLASDLGTKVREDRGLAYYVGAYQLVGLEPGAYVLYAGTRKDALPEVESLMKEEIERIISKGIRKDELERSRKRIIAEFEMSSQNNSGLAMNCALNELYGLGYKYPLKTKERFEKVTGEDVRRAAASLLSVKKLAVSIVSPKEKK